MTLKHCFNWKVLAGVGVAVLGVLLLSPGLFARVLPWLIVAVCPLSMVAMMVGMGAMKMKDGVERPDDHVAQAPPVAGLPCCGSALFVRPPVRDRVAELKAQLADLAAEQQRIAQEVARLEGERDASETEEEANTEVHA